MQTKKCHFWLFILLLTAACSYRFEHSDPIFIPPSSTNAPILTATTDIILPAEKTSVPTQAVQTPTPLVISGYSQGAWVILLEAGFAFTIPVNDDPSIPEFDLKKGERQASIASADEVLLISIYSSENSQASSAEACLDLVQAHMIEDLGDVIPEEPEPILVGNREGLVSQVIGDIFNEDFKGKLVGVLVKPGTCLTALGIAIGPEADERWEDEGEPALAIILRSMVISETGSSSSACEVSNDAAYGFSMDKPIQVGNTNLYDGITREGAYLASLRGLESQKITFTRLKSVVNPAGDILDVYEITYAGLDGSLMLYLDMYKYAPLKAPQGFICPESIPFGAP